MSSDKIVLDAQKREVTGKKVKALRRDGIIPATMYEKGKDSVSLQMPYMKIKKTWEAAGKSQPVELSVEGKKHLAMIKDATYDPVKATLTHVAFHAINKNEVVEAEVQIHLEGDVPAEQQGNFIVRPNDVVTIKALPADLPEVLNVSAEMLVEVGDTLKVSDIEVPEGVEIVTDPELPIVVVEEPRVQEEPEETEEVDAADVPSDHGSEEESTEENTEEKSE